MPSNLYGPGDNFNLTKSHVIPAILLKTYEAKINNKKFVEIWGSGKPLREFLYIDDCAEGIIFLMENYSNFEHINLGSGSEISIEELAKVIFEIVGFDGEIKFNLEKPDGTKRKLLDSSKINKLGWNSNTSLEEGLKLTFEFLKTKKIQTV